MNTLAYSKYSFSVGSFPIAFSVLTFALQLAQGFLPASPSPWLTVARKASPSSSPVHPLFVPTPTIPCTPTPTLSSDYPDVSATARPLLASLILVMLGMLVFAGSTYIRRKSGTIFTPLTPPSRKERDTPQPPSPPSPNPNEDDLPADNDDEGEEDGDGDSDDDRDSSSEDEDESDDGSDDEDDDPDDPDDPSGDSDVEDPPSPPVDPGPWEILLLGILYLAGVMRLTGKLSSAPLRRIINSLSHRLNNISNQITVNFKKVVDCALVWLDQSLLQLYDEMMWINNEHPPRPVFDIGMRNLGSKCMPMTLYATDELRELRQALIHKIETASQASSTWASKVCPFLRRNDEMQSSPFNDTITSNMAWSRARPPYSPSKDDAIIPKPTTTSSVHSILSAAMVYGVIGALIQTFRNAHARRARNEQEFGQEGTTLFENASNAMNGSSEDDENEDPEEGATHPNILQGPDSVTADERYICGNSDREHDHDTDHLSLPEAEELFDASESAISYITALSVSTFASLEELRIRESPIPFQFVPSLLPTITDIFDHSINNINIPPARVGFPGTHKTTNINGFVFPATLPPPDEYFDREPENIEVDEEEDDRAQEHYIQEEDWYDEVPVDTYHGFYEDRECETGIDSPEECESSAEGGRYVEEEDMYEEENLYGDEYPGFYHDYDVERDEPDGRNDEEECPNNQEPEEGPEDMDFEESEPSSCASETYPEGLRPISHKDRALKITSKGYVDGKTMSIESRTGPTASVPCGESREAMILQRLQFERVRQRYIEVETARIRAAGDSAHFPDEPIEGSDISIYFRRRPSSKFQYTEEDSLEGQSAAPPPLTSIPEEKRVQMRAFVEKAYSSRDYDPSQIDALTYWHLGLKYGEDPC